MNLFLIFSDTTVVIWTVSLANSVAGRSSVSETVLTKGFFAPTVISCCENEG